MGCGSTKSEGKFHKDMNNPSSSYNNVNSQNNNQGYQQNAQLSQSKPQNTQNNNQNQNLILHTNSINTKYPRGKAILMRRFDL